MAKKRGSVRLTNGELSMVRILWEQGAATLSEAHQAMQQQGETVGYTTVQTRLERLVAKGIVTKKGHRPARYHAAVSPDQVSRPLIDLLLHDVSGPVPLVAHLLEDPSLTADDLREMKRLIAEAEAKAKMNDNAKPNQS